MATPGLSCNTDALSDAPNADSDDEGPQSSMWVQEEGHTSSELPPDFLEPLSPGVEVVSSLPPFPIQSHRTKQQDTTHESRQFWKSGDFTGAYDSATFATEGMDHARVHPKFLHSNATSHKWVLGAVAELLDNAVDEIRNGATFVKVDVIPNPRNGDPMLVIEDDGGGMDPECMRRCMSLGFSAKSKLSNTIGQYGNGFKTSTMRLGADVMVFTRSGVGKSSQSIGMMSYTFLTATGQNDIVVPIVDFQMEAFGIRKLIRSNVEDWNESMEAIEKWSPYSSQTELVNQFKLMPRRQGTRVVIYNLWEDEEGLPELDFNTDPLDIQIRATSRDERTLKLAALYASCWHYFTYRHSLRTYISILYLRLPSRFRIFLRGKQVQPHSLRNEMMLVEEVTYKPKDAGQSKAVVTLGFVKDAKEHLDISGFNVYHKNRLIKPFWRIWNTSNINGRGIIGILEANFVEPAHDKQGFERTIVLSRLEARLVEMQKSYWSKNCHKIGYVNTRLSKHVRLDSVDNNRATNGGKMESAQRNAQNILMVDSTVTKVHTSANGVRDVSHTQGIGKQQEPLAVTSALMTLAKQEVCVTPARLEMQGRLGSSIDRTASGVGEHKSSFFDGQDFAYVAQEGASSDKVPSLVRDPGLSSATLDSQAFVTPVVPDARSNLQVTCFGPVSLDSEAVCPPSSLGRAPTIIDLDSPHNEQEFDTAAFEIPCLQNCDGSKSIMESPFPDLADVLRGASACESTLSSRERSENIAGCLEGSEGRRLIGASGSFPAGSCCGEVETSPGRLGTQSFSQLHETVAASPDKATLMSQVEARAERLGIESCAPLSEMVTTSKAAPSTVPSFEDLPTMQTNGDMSEFARGSLLQGKTVVENASGQDTIMIDAANMEASEPLKSSTVSAEGHVSAIFESNDLLDNPTPQDEVRPCSPQIVKAGDASVACPVVDMDLPLPDVLVDATLEAVKGCMGVQFSAGRGIQQVASALTEEDATLSNSEEQGDGCQTAKETLEESNVREHVSATCRTATVALSAVKHFDFEQEGRSSLISRAVIYDAGTSDNNQASSEGVNKDMVRVSQEPTTIFSQSATTLGKVQASNQAFQQVHAAVSKMPTMAMATRDMSISSHGDVSIQDGSLRLLFAKQSIESLQQSIEDIVAETDDIREQLQQQRHLQDIDLRNLNMELERALLHLEKLKR